MHLLISYAKFRDDGKEQEPSKFIAEILDANSHLKVTTVALDSEVMDQFTMLEFVVAAPEIEKLFSFNKKSRLAPGLNERI